MKKTFLKLLAEKIKDMGLSDEAIAELVELGAKGLADDASEEDIKAKVDSIVPFAKAMQGEFTRKVQKVKQSTKPTKQSKQEGEDGDEDGDEGNIPASLKSYFDKFEAKLTALETENAELKSKQVKEARVSQIAAKAKELGIPDFLMKRFSIADDADFVKELTEYKQDLVTNKLMPADAAGEQGNQEQAMKDAAKAWAETLPNQ